uniref:Tc1-like transposase DDE domain-containing protein n=1 Tax=Salarias fasciatus TaxID=181472 RepID=A0A672JGS6_SALFA
MSIDDQPTSGRPSTSRTAEVVGEIEDVRGKQPTLWRGGDWWIHHHVAQFLAKNGMTLLPHPPYSPDLAPCDFSLFPRLKKQLKGRRFADVEEVTDKAQQVLKGIISLEFADTFIKRETWLECCINADGDYFEGDGGVLF